VIGPALWLAGACAALANDERALWELWQTHTRLPDQPATVVAACRAYVSERPDDRFVPVAQGIEAWHLLRARQTATAVERLELHLDAGPGEVAGGARRLARAWLTRLDRDRLVNALQAYYREEVRYPASMEALFNHPGVEGPGDLPRTDRWEAPWRYRLVGYEGVPGFRDQRYLLESPVLAGRSDFATALEAGYASRMPLRPTRVTAARGSGKGTTVRFEPTRPGESGSGPVVLSVGGQAQDVYLAYLGSSLVVVCDDLHWAVYPRPGTNR
jgi:hypothetical protein